MGIPLIQQLKVATYIAGELGVPFARQRRGLQTGLGGPLLSTPLLVRPYKQVGPRAQCRDAFRQPQGYATRGAGAVAFLGEDGPQAAIPGRRDCRFGLDRIDPGP